MANLKKTGKKYRVKRRYQPYTKLMCWMRENGITQQDLADLLGKSRHAINRNLNGVSGDFSMDEVRKICLHYGISADAFFIEQKVS